mgnify:CR=1 FL=1
MVLKIRSYIPSDRDAVIKLIQRSASTNRTPNTWDQNNMTAALAFENDTMIGALPMETRQFEIGNGRSSKVLWISAAHVDEEYRSQGIGARLDEFIRKNHETQIDALCVYRGDVSSLAYKWYNKMNYSPVSTLLSFTKNVAFTKNKNNYFSIEEISKIQISEHKILRCFQLNTKQLGGFPKRKIGYWSKLFSAHYYKNNYKFAIITIPSKDGENYSGYALVGLTSMRDNISRLEILEFIFSNAMVQELLHQSITDYAITLGVKEIRIQIGYDDQLQLWFRQNGYVKREYSTFILVSFLKPLEYLKNLLKERAICNLLIETEISQGFVASAVSDSSDIPLSIYMKNEILTKLLFGRTTAKIARNEGNLILRKGEEEQFDEFSSVFKPTNWRYFQSDYI